MKTCSSVVELLESRIAPASLAVNLVTKTATWTDWDGDLVTLKWNKGTSNPGFLPRNLGEGQIIDLITLSPVDHQNIGIAITVKAAGGGDGLSISAASPASASRSRASMRPRQVLRRSMPATEPRVSVACRSILLAASHSPISRITAETVTPNSAASSVVSNSRETSAAVGLR